MRPLLLAVALATPLLVACPKPSDWWHMAVGTPDTHEVWSELEDGETTLHWHERHYRKRPKWGVGRVEGGQLVGPWTLFHPNGNVKAKTSFEDGEMNGETSFHWQHGGVHAKGMMDHGRRVGEWQEFEYGETNPKRSQE